MALQHLRSSTADKRPTPAAMSDGQLAMNTNLASPGLFLKDSNGDLVKVGPVHVGTTAPNATPGAGGQAGNSKGEQWLDTSSSRYVFKIWDGTAWRTEDGEFVNVSGDTMTGALGIIAGTNTAPGVFFSGDTNTGIYSPGADQLAISTNAVERVEFGTSEVVFNDGGTNYDFRIEGDTNANLLFVDASTDRVGIGTTSPAATLDVNGDVTISDKIIHTGDTNTAIRFPAADTVTVETSGAERVRVDSAGRLLVGPAASSIPTFGTESGLQLHNVASANGAQLSIVRFNTDTGAGTLVLGKSRSATVAAGAVVANNDGLGNITFVGDDGTDLGSRGAQISAFVDGTPGVNDMPGRLVFSTTADGDANPTERLRIDSAGTTTLTSAAATSPFIAKISTSEVARIDSSGRLLVGTSSGRNVGESLQANIQIETAGGAPSLSIVNNENEISSPSLKLGKSRGASNGSSTIVQSGDGLGAIIFAGADGTNLETPGAYIQCFVDGTPGTDDMPGRLVFSTTADGASTPTQRMVIFNSGTVLMGNGAVNQTGLTFNAATSTTNTRLYFNRATTASSLEALVFADAGITSGSITYTNTATAYNTSSDYRLKENITLLDGAIDRLNQLPVHRFNFIADPDTVVDGFIAHEAQAVVPECVTGEKDAVDDEGNPKYQGIDQSKLVPLLTAALQEAIAKIEDLEGRLTAAGL
jgi:hypothetical protein